MELEELKNSRHVIRAPRETAGETVGPSHGAIDSLIDRLKAEDAKQLASLKRARPLWGIAAALWVFSIAGMLLSGLESSSQSSPAFPLRGLIALVFSGLAVGCYLLVKKISAIDYAEPVTLFLRKAATRYQFMSTPYLVLSVLITAVLALAASMYIVDVLERRLEIHDDSVGIVLTFAFVGLVYLFGYHFSRKAWKRTRGPMLEEIRKMQVDLQSDSA